MATAGQALVNRMAAWSITAETGDFNSAVQYAAQALVVKGICPTAQSFFSSTLHCFNNASQFGLEPRAERVGSSIASGFATAVMITGRRFCFTMASQCSTDRSPDKYCPAFVQPPERWRFVETPYNEHKQRMHRFPMDSSLPK